MPPALCGRHQFALHLTPIDANARSGERSDEFLETKLFSLMDILFGQYDGDLAIDLGTANTLVSVRG